MPPLPLPPAYLPIKAFGLAGIGAGLFFAIVFTLPERIASSLGSFETVLIFEALLDATLADLEVEPCSGAGAALLLGGISPAPVLLLPKFTSIYSGNGGTTVGVGSCHFKTKKMSESPRQISPV